VFWVDGKRWKNWGRSGNSGNSGKKRNSSYSWNESNEVSSGNFIPLHIYIEGKRHLLIYKNTLIRAKSSKAQTKIVLFSLVEAYNESNSSKIKRKSKVKS
jgi:hypothetical protein